MNIIFQHHHDSNHGRRKPKLRRARGRRRHSIRNQTQRGFQMAGSSVSRLHFVSFLFIFYGAMTLEMTRGVFKTITNVVTTIAPKHQETHSQTLWDKQLKKPKTQKPNNKKKKS